MNFQLLDIIGSYYTNGPVKFMPDGHHLISSNGNKLKFMDLKRNVSCTSKLELRSNISNFAINSAGTHIFIADETRHCAYVNLSNDTILHSFFVPDNIGALSFSPDNKFIAIGVGGFVKVYSIAVLTKMQFNPFLLVNKFQHSTEKINSIDWSFDGRLIVVGGQNHMVKIFSSRKNTFKNIGVFTFGEQAPLIDVWFYNEGYNIISIHKGVKASVWECTHEPQQLIPASDYYKKQTDSKQLERVKFVKAKMINFAQYVDSATVILSSTINKQKMLLALGFNGGVFCIFDLPQFALLQKFCVGEMEIRAVNINSTGDWLAIGCGIGIDAQLIVWEWQSETYITRQRYHTQNITTSAYLPDGSLLATGAEDGKVKLWNCDTSFCVVTFIEHEAAISDICFTQTGRVILSASIDGTIRAHDLKRYRNFRTLVAPKQTQLKHLCADALGDIVMASSHDLYEIYIWALETGQLLDVLTGHQNVISGLTSFGNTLYTVSLDKTLRFWNILEGCCLETIQLSDEGLDVKLNPLGSEIAVLCYDSSIIFCDTKTNQQTGLIETKFDIDTGYRKKGKLKKSTSEENRVFTCIAYSPNGQFLLSGGQSNTFCLYSVPDRIRIRSFKLNANFSLEGTIYDIDYRKITEFGNLNNFDLSESDEEKQNGANRLQLPGAQYKDFSKRLVNYEILIRKLVFSPTGQDFAVVSNNGVYIFTLRQIQRFDPYQLETNVTPTEIFRLLHCKEYAKALIFAFKLNDDKIIQQIIESIPMDQYPIVVRGIRFEYAERLFAWLVSTNGFGQSRHFHFYLLFVKELLFTYGAEFKRALDRNKPIMIATQQILANQQNQLLNTSMQNMYSLEYIISTMKLSRIRIAQ